MRRLLVALSIVVASFAAAATGAAQSDKRVALVIGNAGYAHAGRLANPVNDAEDVAAKLRQMRFDVVFGRELTHQGMRQTLREFRSRADGADVALFFYAGHGMQVGGSNVLLPIDARLEDELDVDAQTVRLDTVLGEMERAARVSLVLLDACRDNPLAERLRRSLGARARNLGLSRGLAPVASQGSDTLIMFATAPGDTAADGEGRNSPFTSALLRHFGKAEEVSVLLKDVVADVRAATSGRQRPQQLAAMERKLYLSGLPGPAADQAEAARLRAEVERLKREEEARQKTAGPALPPQPAPRGSARRGGTLSFAVPAEPHTLDCQGSSSFALVHPVAPFYSQLVRYDPSQGGRIGGDVASSWSVAPNGLAWEFRLHPNVRFHDATPLTSADVKATFERIKDPPAGVVSMRRAMLEDVEAIEAPDAVTVVFRMKRPNAALLDHLAAPFNCLYSAARLQQDARFPEKIILGTGPFQFVQYVKGSHITGKRFDGYFRQGLPYLDGYKAMLVKGTAIVPGMTRGDFDVEFRGRTPKERDELVAADRTRWIVHQGPWATNNVLIVNVAEKPFDDPRVRRALSLAIDRWGGNELLARLTVVRRTGGFLRPGSDFALTEQELVKFPGFGRDIEKSRAEARRLLAEAGVPALKLKLLNRNVGQPYTPLGVFLVDQWRRVGIEAAHEQVETKAFFEAVQAGHFSAAVHSYAMGTDDVAAYHEAYLSRQKSALSLMRHQDRTVDTLWETALRATDPAQRRAVVHDLERHLLTEGFVLPLVWSERIVVHHRRVKGWHFSASHFIGQDLASVWLDE